MQILNQFHPNFKHTRKASTTSANFLDISVVVETANFITKLYNKATDCHQFLHYNSSHPSQVKKLFIYNQDLRIKRLYTSGFLKGSIRENLLRNS